MCYGARIRLPFVARCSKSFRISRRRSYTRRKRGCVKGAPEVHIESNEGPEEKGARREIQRMVLFPRLLLATRATIGSCCIAIVTRRLQRSAVHSIVLPARQRPVPFSSLFFFSFCEPLSVSRDRLRCSVREMRTCVRNATHLNGCRVIVTSVSLCDQTSGPFKILFDFMKF